jgi:hypothetical protein
VSARLEPSLAVRLEQMNSGLAGQASRIRRGALLTLLGGLLVLGLLGAYFYYGYTQFSEFTQPDRIAGVVQTLVDDNLPSMRKSVESEITRSAPVLAEKLSVQLRDNIPTGRQKLEDYIITQMKVTLAQGNMHTSEMVTEFLRTNRDKLRANAKELAKSPELAEGSIKDLEKTLELQIGTDLKGQATELMTALNSMNDKLQKLTKASGLNKTEALERRLLQIARRLQMEQVSTADPVTRATGSVQPISTDRTVRRDDRERKPVPDPKPEATTTAPAKVEQPKKTADAPPSTAAKKGDPAK